MENLIKLTRHTFNAIDFVIHSFIIPSPPTLTLSYISKHNDHRNITIIFYLYAHAKRKISFWIG